MVNTQSLNDLVSDDACMGNLHVMLKMKGNTSVADPSSFAPLIPRDGFKLPVNGNQTLIIFDSQNLRNCPCGVFQIFEDSDLQSTTDDANGDSDSGNQKQSTSNDVTMESHWYQIKDTVKYFSDVLFNGTSVTNIWMNPKLLE